MIIGEFHVAIKNNYKHMKYVFFFILIGISIKVNAQEYHPFPTENARWAYYYSMEGLNYWTLYYLNGDTLLKQKTYHVINRKRLYEPNTILNTLEDLYFREEDKRIYFINTFDKDKEILTYDFNLAVGDKFYLESFDTLVVKDVSIKDGKKELLLECLNVEYLGVKLFDIWVEGIGSKIDFEKPNVYSSLMCFKGDNDHSNTCGYIDEILAASVPIVDKSKNLIYPNPTCDKLYFQIDKAKYNKYKIFDLNGKLMKLEEIDKNYIDVSDLDEGIYLVQFIGGGIIINSKFKKTNNQ
jgi:hypothetical protein